jgi:hypothetical protein
VGISIELEAVLPQKSVFSWGKGKKDWEDTVLSALKCSMSARGLNDFIPIIIDRPKGRLPIHYCEEWPDISVEDGKFIIAARTSTCGPGFHAMFCDAIDAIEKKHNLKFVETEISIDETGYFASRDFRELQTYFANWLKELGQSVLEQASENNGFRLQMALEQLAPDSQEGNVLTPRGPKSASYLKSFVTMKEEEIFKAAEHWYPWWNKQPNAPDLVKMAEQLMWSDIPWNAPETDEDRNIFVAASNALERAKTLGANISNLNTEILEMKRFLGRSEQRGGPPSQSGIGYRRNDCRWPLTRSWNGLLPGYLYEIHEDDNYQLFCEEFIVRLTSLAIEPDREEFVLPEDPGEHKVLAQGKNKTFGWRIERANDIDDNGWLTSFVFAGSKNNMLIATFTHLNTFDQSDLMRFVDKLLFVNEAKQ